MTDFAAGKKTPMTTRTSRTAIVIAVAVATVAACAALYASPYWALRTLSTAVQNQDAATVAEHVDFPALREDLKGQLLLKVQREMARPGVESQPFSGLGQMFAMGLVNQMVDGLVSPTGVALALKNGAVLRSIASGIPGNSSELVYGAGSTQGRHQQRLHAAPRRSAFLEAGRHGPVCVTALKAAETLSTRCWHLSGQPWAAG